MSSIGLSVGVSEMLLAIEREGFYASTKTVSTSIAASMRTHLDALYEMNQFKRAGVGKGASLVIDESIRNDSIRWVEKQPQHKAVAAYSSFLQELIPQLNRHFFLPLKDIELMYAIYEKGSFYKRHRDRFESHQHRFFTVVLYLTDWQPGDGGELVLYTENGSIEIKPKAGTFLIFLSETEHEVLPTQVRRYSLTGWITDVPIGLTFL